MGYLITEPPKEKMTKKDHQLEIQEQLRVAGLSLNLETISAVYEAFVDTIGYALGDGHNVVVPGLGRFESRYRRPKTFRSPDTGEPVSLSERYVPFLAVSRKLKKYTWNLPITEPKPAYNRAEVARERERRIQMRRLGYDPNDPDAVADFMMYETDDDDY